MEQHEALLTMRSVGVITQDNRPGDVGVLSRHPETASSLCRELALPWVHDAVEVVVVSEFGKVALAAWTAHWLKQMTGREILALYAREEGDDVTIWPGCAELLAGRKVLVVESFMTQDCSLNYLIRVLRQIGCQVVGASTLFVFGRPKFLVGTKYLVEERS